MHSSLYNFVFLQDLQKLTISSSNNNLLLYRPELSMYQKRLAQYRRSPSSTLRSFEQFCRLGASPHESLTLCKIKGVVKKHLSAYTIGLNGKDDAWKKFGQFNDSTGSFEFCPHKFIQPLKDHMIFRTQFQEMMAHTVRNH